MLVAVEDPDDDSRKPEQHDDREQQTRQVDRELAVAEGAHHPGRDDDEEGGDPAQAEQDEPEQTRRNAPGTFALPLLEQVPEDRDERRGERSVGDESADGIRDQEGDLERVDRTVRAEVVAGDRLANQAENA